MIGALPTSLTVNGREWAIRTDYRIVLRTFEALEDEELTQQDKLQLMFKRMYVDFEKMPTSDYEEAYKKLFEFMECHDRKDDSGKPRLISWQKDEQMIFPAINAVAGCEVRALEYMHWWTFLGYFENIDNECVWSFVLSIRQKRANGKKLEKHEKEFFAKNRDLFDISKKKAETATSALEDMFNSLLQEGGSEDG